MNANKSYAYRTRAGRRRKIFADKVFVARYIESQLGWSRVQRQTGKYGNIAAVSAVMLPLSTGLENINILCAGNL